MNVRKYVSVLVLFLDMCIIKYILKNVINFKIKYNMVKQHNH